MKYRESKGQIWWHNSLNVVLCPLMQQVNKSVNVSKPLFDFQTHADF